MSPRAYNPKTDLLLERVVDVRPELVWKGWTTPELIKQWFCPRPWTVSDCELDLRPGGAFNTVFRSPEGEAHPNEGCVLEVVPGKRLVWTDALTAGYRPSSKGYASKGLGFAITAVIELAPEGQGTRYTAWVQHADEAGREQHAQMGFQEGWGTALDQLVALMQGKA